MPVATSTARLEARISTDLHSMLKRAAELQGRTMTDFVVSAVQDAARDAEDQLAALAGSRAQAQALDEAAAAARRALQDAERRYAAGLIDFTTLLDTRRTLLALDSSRASADTDARLARIRLLKALGGPLDSPTP